MPEKSLKKININLYLGILHKRRYLALTAALIIVSFFTWGGFFMPKSYQEIPWNRPAVPYWNLS